MPTPLTPPPPPQQQQQQHHNSQHFGICKALKAVGADDKKKNKINETAKQLLYDSNNWPIDRKSIMK